jgi:hypothetical protein
VTRATIRQAFRRKWRLSVVILGLTVVAAEHKEATGDSWIAAGTLRI